MGNNQEEIDKYEEENPAEDEECQLDDYYDEF